MAKYALGSVVEIHSLPPFPGVESWNGIYATVAGTPGFYSDLPNHYAIRLPWGLVTPAAEEFIRLPPPASRGDLDTKVSWEEFELATGINPDIVRGTDSQL